MNGSPYRYGDEDDEKRNQDPSWHRHNRIVAGQRIDEIRLNLDPRHLFASAERGWEDIVQACRIGTDQNDFVAEHLRINLAAEHAVVRRKRVAAVWTAKVDHVTSGREIVAAGRLLLRRRFIDPVCKGGKFLLLKGDGESAAPHDAVGISDQIRRPVAARVLANERDRQTEARSRTKVAVDLGMLGREDDIACLPNRLCERLVLARI